MSSYTLNVSTIHFFSSFDVYASLFSFFYISYFLFINLYNFSFITKCTEYFFNSSLTCLFNISHVLQFCHLAFIIVYIYIPNLFFIRSLTSKIWTGSTKRCMERMEILKNHADLKAIVEFDVCTFKECVRSIHVVESRSDSWSRIEKFSSMEWTPRVEGWYKYW